LQLCKCIKIKILWKCSLAPLFCKKCQALCAASGPHSCCRCEPLDENPPDQEWGCPCSKITGGDGQANVELGVKCCGDCCIKIPMIELKCEEDASFQEVKPSLLPTPFAPGVCNQTQIKGFCKDCAGTSLPFISAWVQCLLEDYAAQLNMLKFDFYNDWVNGSLYFPLIKRKFKVKKGKNKAGQIKKDKFCDFDCARTYQSGSTTCYRVSVINTSPLPQTVRIKKHGNLNNFQGDGKWCDITFSSKNTGGNVTSSPWECGKNDDIFLFSDDQNIARRQAYRGLSIPGIGEMGEGCYVTFGKCYKSNGTGPDCPNAFKELTDNPSLSVDLGQYQIKEEHDKPYYIEVQDPLTGIRYQKNFGGHGHHKNKCNRVFRVERLEYWQNGNYCAGTTKVEGELVGSGVSIPSSDEIATEDDGFFQNDNPCTLDGLEQCESSSCLWGACACTGKGTDRKRPCCKCNPRYNEDNIRRGIIKMEDDVLYYASIRPSTGDVYFNKQKIEYKSNLFFPTNICEVGSSVFCDIDEIPFIMDQIPPTTFSISEETQAFDAPDFGGGNGTEGNPINLSETENKEGAVINYNGYTSFGCFGAKCLNTQASVNQSQIGVETIDKNDLGLEIGKCKMLFDHDEEIREYFCRRFSGYKNDNLDIHYQRPGSSQYDNVYNTYPSGVWSGSSLWFSIDGGPPTQGTVNDDDEILFGDRCGIQYTSYTYNFDIDGINYGAPVSNQIGDIDYFYGLAPSITWGNNAFDPVFPTYNGFSVYGPDSYGQITKPSINIDSNGGQEERGINFGTSQTPYYFYFGIVPGKTALHKVVSKYFADKIDETTLEKLSGEKRNNQSNFKNIVKNPLTLYKTCLGNSIKSTS